MSEPCGEHSSAACYRQSRLLALLADAISVFGRWAASGRSRSYSVRFRARMPVGAEFSRESGHPGIAEIGQDRFLMP